MPANLPPAYHEIEARYRAAKTSEEKIAALEEMLRQIPKHKGTDRLQGDLKARLAKLRRQPRKSAATQAFSHHIPKEGAGQVALAGPPNGGKSSLVAALTHARPEIAEFPFTTREPLPGMMSHEDVAFQLVDLPPLSDEHVPSWLFEIVRNADLVWIVVDAARSLDGIESVERLLGARSLALFPAGSPAPEPHSAAGAAKPAIVVVTGLDRPGASGSLAILKELVEAPWPIVGVSTVDGRGLDDLRRRTFEAMDVVRVYTKQPGKPPDRERPFALPRGSTVADLARLIHNDLLERLRFARIWGEGVFDGQTVQRDHVLADRDVVEIHA